MNAWAKIPEPVVLAELCVAAYEALKERKFGGDFDGLLAWWQEHKPVAHRAMARFDDPAR